MESMEGRGLISSRAAAAAAIFRYSLHQNWPVGRRRRVRGVRGEGGRNFHTAMWVNCVSSQKKKKNGGFVK